MTTTTKYYRFKIYVGPVHVEHYGDVARAAGMTNLTIGTEHIYGTVAAAPCTSETDRLVLRHRIAEQVYGQPGHSTGWRDVTLLGND